MPWANKKPCFSARFRFAARLFGFLHVRLLLDGLRPLEILLQRLIDQHRNDHREHILGEHIDAVINAGIDPGGDHAQSEIGIGHPAAPDPNAGHVVAKEAQEEGYGDTDRDGLAVPSENAGEADDRIGDDIRSRRTP